MSFCTPGFNQKLCIIKKMFFKVQSAWKIPFRQNKFHLKLAKQVTWAPDRKKRSCFLCLRQQRPCKSRRPRQCCRCRRKPPDPWFWDRDTCLKSSRACWRSTWLWSRQDTPARKFQSTRSPSLPQFRTLPQLLDRTLYLKRLIIICGNLGTYSRDRCN